MTVKLKGFGTNVKRRWTHHKSKEQSKGIPLLQVFNLVWWFFYSDSFSLFRKDGITRQRGKKGHSFRYHKSVDDS
jgi:predicted GIY-YIG superfamily endonuclease